MDPRLDETARRVMLKHLAERWKWVQDVKRQLLSYEGELAAFIRQLDDVDTKQFPKLPER